MINISLVYLPFSHNSLSLAGLTTEQFIEKVGWRLNRYLLAQEARDDAEDEQHQHLTLTPSLKFRRNYNVDRDALQLLFQEFDTDKSGKISLDELENMLSQLGGTVVCVCVCVCIVVRFLLLYFCTSLFFPFINYA